MASPDISGSQVQGKSRFYAEYIRLSDNLVREKLFGHRELQLSSWPKDYGDMRVYSGSSSSSKMSSMKEQTYWIARSLGASSNSWVVANVDYRVVGLLPSPSTASFVDACSGSLSAPEVERDLIHLL